MNPFAAIILDTETTGLTEPRPVEVAWIALDDPIHLAEVDAFAQRYNPGKAIEYGAMATHHIQDADVAECPAWDTFALPVGVEYVIGHNIDFDVAALPGGSLLMSSPLRRICTEALARSLWPTMDSFKLGALLYKIEPETASKMRGKAHTAVTDVHFCKILLAEELLWLDGRGVPVSTWEEVWTASEKARIPTIATFGKHKGTPLKDLPADYVRWMLKQPDLDPYLRKALEALG
jgi:exodeoxyribonuclease X